MQNVIHEIKMGFERLNSQDKQRFVRFVEHIVKPDGFYEAYVTFVDEGGGLEYVGLTGVNRFMDEWDKAVAI